MTIDAVRIVIVGGGVAGAATAAALARAGMGPGVILEREPIPGSHASGKNAGIACIAEFDPLVRRLAVESVFRLHRITSAGVAVVRRASGLYLGGEAQRDRFARCVAGVEALGARAALLDRDQACARFPFLAAFAFDLAMESLDEGVIDVHALLLAYLDEARQGRFSLLTRTDATDLRIEGSRVCGVVTSRGTIRADVVVDASGAWAGRLGRSVALPLQPVRRHLFVSANAGGVPSSAPLVWHVRDGYYFRPEGAGLLLSPCDESIHPPEPPQVDPAAADLLATKLAATAPALADLAIRSSWACLRTFAPDRRPIIGADPEIAGLFHVSGLGGFGMGTSWAVGEVASAIVRGAPVPFIDAADVGLDRLATAPAARERPEAGASG
jgi:D-arginine dehydrogenase